MGEIRNAGQVLNLELLGKESVEGIILVRDKGERSTTRRKGIERELRNLSFNINYEKGKTEMGLCSDS